MRKAAFSILSLVFTSMMLAFFSHPEPVVDDGPYVLYHNGKVYAKYIMRTDAAKTVRTDSLGENDRERLAIRVDGDEPGQSFFVTLKPQLTDEKSEYKNAKKILAISDIEGNFRALRRLLQGNGVIDKDFNWTFGTGHLVLTGDFFDRGAHVTEVLWLIYSLEEKAKAAGGYVHYILGNHEIMNLNGDIRYVNAKYFENAALMNEDYMALYSDSAELGRWLRTKNVIERVGDILFVHGGISQEVNALDIQAAKINRLVRPFYADTSYQYPDARSSLLYSDAGPFWYRGYYMEPSANMAQVDSTLNLFGTKYIATGHTIIADTITVNFNGTVFNTDVHHASGRSEALLLENGHFYRVDAVGQRSLIRN